MRGNYNVWNMRRFIVDNIWRANKHLDEVHVVPHVPVGHVRGPHQSLLRHHQFVVCRERRDRLRVATDGIQGRIFTTDGIDNGCG